MAKNDLILLDGILDQRITERSLGAKLDEVFELFAFEELLKDYDLSEEELDVGWVDGADDGGIDGFYTFVNGHILKDPELVVWPRRDASLEVWLFTVKHHSTFQQAPLNFLLASLPEILDLGIERSELKGRYSDDVLRARSFLHLAFRQLSSARANLSFRIIYASRGDTSLIAENVAARAAQITSIVESLFSASSAKFEFIGAAELVSSYRRTKKFSLELPFVEYLARGRDSYLLLARLADFKTFVSDEIHLRRYLFDSNVRDYLGDTRVNEDIGVSLQDKEGPDFWWLNNGVTILATGATVLGKTIRLEDVQIVNGLQTTETIFRHIETEEHHASNRALLVKVVVSTDAKIRDQIIRATNNQSVVEVSSLHATDKIQRDIEAVLETSGWFYERRKNYYRNIGKPASRLVTPMYIAAGFVSLVIKNPVIAAGLKSRFMRNPYSYAAVFSEKLPLEVWPRIAQVLKTVEEVLIVSRPEAPSERFLASWRNLIALLTVARILAKYSYDVHEFTSIDSSKITQQVVSELWTAITTIEQPKKERAFRSKEFVLRCCALVADKYAVEGIEVVCKRTIPSGQGNWGPTNSRLKPTLTDEFLDQVNAELASQPWKPGEHRRVAQALGSSVQLVSAAIQELILRGRRMPQRDGVVYDADGNPTAFDPERVTPDLPLAPYVP